MELTSAAANKMLKALEDEKAYVLAMESEASVYVKQLQCYFGFEQPQAIYKWQWGDCLPSVDNLFALSKILGVPMQEILIESGRDFFIHDYRKMPSTISSYSDY